MAAKEATIANGRNADSKSKGPITEEVISDFMQRYSEDSKQLIGFVDKDGEKPSKEEGIQDK